MIVHLDITLEIRINHLPNRRRAVSSSRQLPKFRFHENKESHIPGNRIILTGLPPSTKRCSSSFTCVVLPLRSSPSRTMNAPRFEDVAGSPVDAIVCGGCRGCRVEGRCSWFKQGVGLGASCEG